jgi:predicted RNA-binding protein with RPS1 domain
MTETLSHVEAPNDVRALLEQWAENPPPSLSAALTEHGQSADALEEYVRSGISTEDVEALRKVLVQGAATGNADDAALLARLTPLLDPRERAWDRMMRSKSTGEALSATVTEAVKGGVVVDVGVRGFVPASQLGLSVPRNLNQYVGRTLKLRVLEVDRRRQTVILSNRVIQEEERAEKRRSAIGRVNEGDEILGTVKRLTDIGAFVDVGGVDGLLHVSEISWKRVEKPSDVLNVGDKVRVKVLKVDPSAGRISLSMRRLAPDPWDVARRKYQPGSVIRVKVVSTVAQGAIVQLDEDLEGFIPISELAARRVATPDEVVQPGQEIEALITDLNVRDRRIVLSIRKLEHRKERQVIDTYQKKARQQQVSGGSGERTTLGDLFGHLFEEYQAPEEPVAPADAATADAETATDEAGTEVAAVEAPVAPEANVEESTAVAETEDEAVLGVDEPAVEAAPEADVVDEAEVADPAVVADEADAAPVDEVAVAAEETATDLSGEAETEATDEDTKAAEETA